MRLNKIISLTILALSSLMTWAVPAHPGMVTVRQPDGKQLTVKLIGDEFFHYQTTTDGYSIERNAQGNYEYVMAQNGRVVTSGILAHDATGRNLAERQFIAGIEKNLYEPQLRKVGAARMAQRDSVMAPHKANLKNYRGLVVLVNLKNKSFRRSDANAFYTEQTNSRNYTGYTDQSTGRWVPCTGSVRDYFYDNSMGQFDPQFDVVGPVTADYYSTSFSGSANGRTIFESVIEQIKGSVDFSKYDSDGDGVVDMVYFIVAGYGANYSGNNSGYLWPHAWVFNNSSRYNGKRLGRYACSVELDGYESYPSTVDIGGIGTMCHEFSHVLGVMDHYDTDYDGSGGQSNHPGSWDVMAGGSYFNTGRTPCGYTAFERYTMGFAKPQVIAQGGDYVLNPVNTSNEGYIIKTLVTNEYFMLDNRQQTRWDTYIPGHGMMVWRVDSTSVSVWTNNHVNVNPEHNYLEIIRAGNASSSSASDPFPGTSHVTMLGSQTDPALVTWAGIPVDLGLKDITETNGVIRFTVFTEDDAKTVIEDFERMPVSSGAKNVQGNFAKWTFAKSSVVETTADQGHGTRMVETIYPCNFYMTQSLPTNPHAVSYQVWNPGTTTAKFRIEYIGENDEKWTTVQTDEVAAGSNVQINVPLTLAEGNQRFRFSQIGGSAKVNCYVDDITFHYLGDEIPLFSGVTGDVNGDGVVDVTDVNLLISVILGTANAETVHDVNGDGKVDVTDVNIIIGIILGNS